MNYSCTTVIKYNLQKKNIYFKNKNSIEKAKPQQNY